MTDKPVLPDFTRWAWASVDERQWWQPLFTRATKAFHEIERYSVVEGHRMACWQPVEVDDMVSTSAWAQRHGLVCIPTNQTKNVGPYAASSADGDMRGGTTLRCLFMRPQQYTTYPVPLLPHQVGPLLGYPDCCQKAFTETWGAGQVDNTWEQWTNSANTYARHKSMSHTLLRWMGIRLVPHMPCTYDCKASNEIADRFYNLGVKLGHKEDMVLMKEVLDWPVAWSRLFGIAEIVTPAVKISTRTDWTPTKDVFKRDGRYNKPEPWLWTDNGFQNPDAMRSAHGTLIESLIDLPKDTRVFDLGCGNGLLLRRLTIRRPDLKIGGIDCNTHAIGHTPPMFGKWMSGTIESGVWHGWAGATIISIQRLLDMSQTDVQAVKAHSPTLFVYAYNDSKISLENLAVQLGINLQMLQKTPEVSIGLLSPK